MNSLDWQPERYSAMGGIAAEGVRNQLGRPRLDLLTVLTRETVQNSWDARLSDAGPVRFAVHGWRATEEQTRVLREGVFRQGPASPDLATWLSATDPPVLLALSDRGTRGLSGPTRADVVNDDGEPRNFVDFLRNVGQPPDDAGAGGTYGYGKAAIFLASELDTILVDSRCLNHGQLQRRLLCMAVSAQYQELTGPGVGRYTGRHWWGRCADDGVVGPVLDREATEIAEALGLPGFNDRERGTTILIPSPRLEDRTPEQAMRFIATSLLWNFWPKMLVTSEVGAPMRFELYWQGQQIALPDPEDMPPLDGFVRAYRALKRHPYGFKDGFTVVKQVERFTPWTRLGTLALERFPARSRMAIDVGDGGTPVPVTEPSRHVALLRTPELIVKYVQGRPLPHPAIEYAGVFLADAATNEAFARAEPPTHDDWVPTLIGDRNDRSMVNVALQRIDDALWEFTEPPRVTGQQTEQAGVAEFADRLGSLLTTIEGPASRGPDDAASFDWLPKSAGNDRAGQHESPGQGKSGLTDAQTRTRTGTTPAGDRKSRRQQAKVLIQGSPRLAVRDGAGVMIVRVLVEHAPGSQGTDLVVSAGIRLDDGEIEKDPPEGSDSPEVLGWVAPDGSAIDESDHIFIPFKDGGDWEFAVRLPGEVLLSVDVTDTARYE